MPRRELDSSATLGLAIGNFILNFGNLDWQLIVFLESRIAPEELARIKNAHFKDRAERVQALLTDQADANGSDDEHKKPIIDDFFKRLHSVRELRNPIADGNLHFQPWAPTITLRLARDLGSQSSDRSPATASNL